MAIIIYAFQDVYKKTHIQSIYDGTGRKLNYSLNAIIKFISMKKKKKKLSSPLQMKYTI